MIFEQDIKKQRAQLWHTAETSTPLRTLDDARQFLNAIGFCLAYPVHPPLLAATFIGAYSGSEEKLPTAKQAFADANARAATELIVRMLGEKSAFEVGFGEDASLLVSAAEFPYFYALVGDRNPKAPPSPGLRGEQALTTHTFEIIDQHGPITEDEMRRKLGREVSRNAIEKVLYGLWSKLRITRVDVGMENGEPVEPVWDLMHRFAPQMVNRGKQISSAEALSALISKYLESVIVAEQKDVETFFGRLVPRSKVTEVCKALLSAQEFSYVQVSGKSMLRLASRGGEDAEQASAGPEDRPAPVHKVRPWQAREQGKRDAQAKRERFSQREHGDGPSAPAFQKFQKDRKPFGEKKPFGERKRFGDRKDFGPRKSFDERGPKRFGERKAFEDRKPREQGGGERKPFGPRKSFSESGKSFADRKAGTRASSGGRPFKKSFGERKPFGDRKSFGERKQFGERKSFGDRPPRKDFKGDYKPRRDAVSSGERRERPFKKDFTPRGDRPFKKDFTPRGDRPFKKDFTPRGDRPTRPFGDKKPFGAKKFGDKKPFDKSFGGKRSFGDKRPFAKRRPPAGDRPRSKRREEPSE